MSGFLRIKEWWNSKIVGLFGLIYLFLIETNLALNQVWEQFSFLALWMILAASFGYYINDTFDLLQDELANKANQTKSQHNLVKIFIALLILTLIGLDWFFLSQNLLVAYLIIGQVSLFFLYSLPKIRLKEKPLVGVLTDALYAHVLPGLIVLFTIVPPEQATPFLLTTFGLWMFFVGVRNILSHHLIDYENDKLSATVTSATYFGKSKVKNCMNFMVSPLESILFLSTLLYLGTPIAWIVLCFILYVVYVYNRELIFVKEHINDWSTEQKENYNFIGGLLLNEFYEKWLPVILLILLCTQNVQFVFILFLHVLLFMNNLKDFNKDYRIIKDLFFVRAYWFLAGIIADIFYYQSYLRLKHFVYWKIYKSLVKNDNSR